MQHHIPFMPAAPTVHGLCLKQSVCQHHTSTSGSISYLSHLPVAPTFHNLCQHHICLELFQRHLHLWCSL